MKVFFCQSHVVGSGPGPNADFRFFTQLTRLTNLHQNIGFLTIGSSIRIERPGKAYILYICIYSIYTGLILVDYKKNRTESWSTVPMPEWR